MKDEKLKTDSKLWITVGLLIVVIVTCVYLFGWGWTGVRDRTLWDWLRLLIVPIAIAGGTLWFNQRQQDRQQEQKEREEEQAKHYETVKALQYEKESVAYIAVLVREQGLPDEKEERAELLMALYLAMIFQHADRSRALVYSALRAASQEKYRDEVMETLKRLIDDFTRYQNELTAAQQKLEVEESLGFQMSSMNKHIARLKVLEKALPQKNEMGSV